MEFRRLHHSDLAAVLEVQEANLFENLSPSARQDGFLSARFSGDEFAQMNTDVSVMVAAEADRIGGYLCASSVELNRRLPLLAAMIACYPDLRFRDRLLSEQASFVYGPVCVDRKFRGRGVLRGLYQALLRQLAGRFDTGAAFIAQDNPRSLAAHVDGLGMHNVGEFEFKQRHYWIVAFPVPVKP